MSAAKTGGRARSQQPGATPKSGAPAKSSHRPGPRSSAPTRSGAPAAKTAAPTKSGQADKSGAPMKSGQADKSEAASASRRAGASPGPLRGRREHGRKALEKRQDAEPRKTPDKAPAKPHGARPNARGAAKKATGKPTARQTAATGKPTARQTAANPADKRPPRAGAAASAGSVPAPTHDEAPRKVPAELTGYLAPPGLEAEVLREVGPCWHQHGRLILCAGPPRPSVWAQDVWLAPQHRVITSIGDAASALRAVQRNWVPLAEVQHRRLALIAEKLPPIKARTWPFPTELPDAAMGAYTLLSHDRLLFSATRSSPFPHGEVEFDEDHEGPPSRAYRKLWEVFTLLQQQPQPGERCIDMGASPGGWTWVLAKLGADVTSVDKAPLAPAIAALPNVQSRVGSAFALRPEHYTREPFEWFFSDVICYPARLLSMVQQWIAADAAKRFVCTIKFQGETDHDTVAAFAAIPGSRLLHLAHNRHELTWVKL
ncbi:MAG: hypothetical protein KC593_14785 [Myxococcales bacterium]|nr:hypothetical protein [Myxococcales bacterium]